MDKLFSDEQLIAFFVMGNFDAWNIFFEIYQVHSINLASEATKIYRGSGLGFDDYYSLCLESIQIALNKYQLYSCTFYSYWKSICLKRIAQYVKNHSYLSKDNIDLNALSLDDVAFSDSSTRYDEIIGEIDKKISRNIINQEMSFYILEKIKLLNEKERQFLFLLIDGYDISAITTIMKLKGKQFYTLRRKIKKKLDIDLIKDYFN